MRGTGRAIAAAACLVCAATARADEDGETWYRLDSKNLFGALEGSDVGEAGDRSVEWETAASLFKRTGRYAFVEQEAIYEITPTPRLGVEFGAHAYAQSIHGQPDDNYAGVDLAALSNEWRYVLIPRAGAWDFQATVAATPQAARLFEGGARGTDLTLPLLLILEVQPVARQLYAAVNLGFAPEWAKTAGVPWARASALQASGALSLRLTPDFMLGAQADALGLYDGWAARIWRGSAFFLGPTFHYQINDKIDLSGAWTQQLAGRSRGASGALNLSQFTRSQAKLRLEVDF